MVKSFGYAVDGVIPDAKKKIALSLQSSCIHSIHFHEYFVDVDEESDDHYQFITFISVILHIFVVVYTMH